MAEPDPPDSRGDDETDRQAARPASKDRSAAVMALVGVLVGGVLGLVGSLYQVFGAQRTAQTQFLRSQQQTAYVQYELDLDLLVVPEKQLANALSQAAASPASLTAAMADMPKLYGKYQMDVDNIYLIGAYRTTQIVQETYVVQERIHTDIAAGIQTGKPDAALADHIRTDIASLDALDARFKNAARSDLGVQ
jgi:hypothetical protein